jgi:hypothetical protein
VSTHYVGTRAPLLEMRQDDEMYEEVQGVMEWMATDPRTAARHANGLTCPMEVAIASVLWRREREQGRE